MIAAQLLAYYFTELKEDQVKKVDGNLAAKGCATPHLPRFYFFNFYFSCWFCFFVPIAVGAMGINPFLRPARRAPPKHPGGERGGGRRARAMLRVRSRDGAGRSGAGAGGSASGTVLLAFRGFPRHQHPCREDFIFPRVPVGIWHSSSG